MTKKKTNTKPNHSDFIVQYDKKYHIIEMNAAYQEQFNKKDTIFYFLSSSEHEDFTKSIKKLSQKELWFSHKSSFFDKNDKQHCIHWITQIFYTQDKKFSHFISTGRDLSNIHSHDFIEIQEHYQELQKSNKKLKKQILQKKSIAEELRYRLKTENIITNLSSKFINVSFDKIDKTIQHSLKVVSEFTGSQRGYIVLFGDNHSTFSRTHEWNINTIPSYKSDIQEIPCSFFPWIIETIRSNKVIHISTIKDLPEEASKSKEMFIDHNIQATLLTPIVSGKRCIGFFGLESPKEKTWAPADIKLCKIVSEIFVNALERKKAEEKLFDSYKYLGIINRQISIILNLGKHQKEKNEKYVIELILNSAKNLSRANICLLYKTNIKDGSLQFFQSSESNRELPKDILGNIQKDQVKFLEPLFIENKRVQASADNFHFFKLHLGPEIKYLLCLPLIINQKLIGSLFLGFSNRDHISTQELDFYDVFMIQASYLFANSESFKELIHSSESLK